MIRSLNIRRGEKPLDSRRLAIHMALATAPSQTLPRSPARARWWPLFAWALLTPSAVALSLRAALWLLRGL
jgi:hypothetical protein